MAGPVWHSRAYVGRDGCNMVGDHPLWRHAEYQYAGRAGTGVCRGLSGVGICFYLPAMSRRVKESLYRRQSQQDSVLPGEEGRVLLTPPRNITVREIRHTLRYQYGRSAPKNPYSADNWLTQRRRTTDPKAHAGTLAGRSGYIIAVGGDPSAAVDNDWFTALRKLRYRPADGIVWVTSGFDGVLTTMNRTEPGSRQMKWTVCLTL